MAGEGQLLAPSLKICYDHQDNKNSASVHLDCDLHTDLIEYRILFKATSIGTTAETKTSAWSSQRVCKGNNQCVLSGLNENAKYEVCAEYRILTDRCYNKTGLRYLGSKVHSEMSETKTFMAVTAPLLCAYWLRRHDPHGNDRNISHGFLIPLVVKYYEIKPAPKQVEKGSL